MMTFNEFKEIINNMSIIYKTTPLYTRTIAILTNTSENYMVQHLIFSTYEKLLEKIYPDDYDKILTFIYNPDGYSVEELYNSLKDKKQITIVYNIL